MDLEAFVVAFDLMEAYELLDDMLIFGGIALALFGQLWGLILVVMGLGIMAMKGEISLGGDRAAKKELSEEEKEYFEYTGEAENEYDGDEAGEGDDGDDE